MILGVEVHVLLRLPKLAVLIPDLAKELRLPKLAVLIPELAKEQRPRRRQPR
jgi:hypothetical protein